MKGRKNLKMPLKKSKGNMYPWVDYMHSHLAGECLHKCSYCYVQKNRFGVSPKYQGKVRLLEQELKVNYGKGRTIFIEHMNDMFAAEIPLRWIEKIISHCNAFPDNQYVFQTKNPSRIWYLNLFPHNALIGTTIETNREIPNSNTPSPYERYRAMKLIQGKKFVTIEPIMDFDVDVLVGWLTEIKPSFVNIGADSKGCGLPEPSSDKVWALIVKLQHRGITIKKKTNLNRILTEGKRNNEVKEVSQ